jgi:hypothetical protein
MPRYSDFKLVLRIPVYTKPVVFVKLKQNNNFFLSWFSGPAVHIHTGTALSQKQFGNVLAPKFSRPAWGYCQFSFRKVLFSNIQGRSTSSLWKNFPPMIST